MSLSLVKSFTTVEEAARAIGISLPAFFFLQHIVLAFYLVLGIVLNMKKMEKKRYFDILLY